METSKINIATIGAIVAAIAALGFSITDFVKPGIEIAGLREDITQLREIISEKNQATLTRVDSEIQRLRNTVTEVAFRLEEKIDLADSKIKTDIESLRRENGSIRARVRQNEVLLATHSGRYEWAKEQVDLNFNRITNLSEKLLSHTHTDKGAASFQDARLLLKFLDLAISIDRDSRRS